VWGEITMHPLNLFFCVFDICFVLFILHINLTGFCHRYGCWVDRQVRKHYRRWKCKRRVDEYEHYKEGMDQ
jgi:hypothetical protein